MIAKDLWLTKQLVMNISVDEDKKIVSVRGFTIPENYSEEEIEKAFNKIKSWISECPSDNIKECLIEKFEKFSKEQVHSREV